MKTIQNGAPLAEFAAFAGEMAESVSLNRSLGQIYGLLYAGGRPMSLQEIARFLKMSKGGASVHLRTLEAWGAVKPVWVPGSRRDHYEAVPDLEAIVFRRLREGLNRRLDIAENHLIRLEKQGAAGNSGKESADSRHFRKRIQELREVIRRARRTLNLLPRVLPFWVK